MNDRFKFRYYYITEKRYLKNSEIQAIAGMSMIEQKANDSAEVEQALCTEICGEIITEQCTGLRDMNGKLVYEGDVVHQTVGGLTCRIVFYRGAFCGEFVGGFTSPLSGWFRPDFDEVIGNIHEAEK